MTQCAHVDQIGEVTPRTPEGCEECLVSGDTWVHLRLCMICGQVGCCDGSKNKHATRHFHATGHPISKQFEPSEDWGWCYVDEMVLDGSQWAIRSAARGSVMTVSPKDRSPTWRPNSPATSPFGRGEPPAPPVRVAPAGDLEVAGTASHRQEQSDTGQGAQHGYDDD